MPVNRNSSLKSSTGSAIVLERMQEELAEVSGARNSSRPSIRIRYYDHHFLLFGKTYVGSYPPPPPAYGLYDRVNDENDGRPLRDARPRYRRCAAGPNDEVQYSILMPSLWQSFQAISALTMPLDKIASRRVGINMVEASGIQLDSIPPWTISTRIFSLHVSMLKTNAIQIHDMYSGRSSATEWP